MRGEGWRWGSPGSSGGPTTEEREGGTGLVRGRDIHQSSCFTQYLLATSG